MAPVLFLVGCSGGPGRELFFLLLFGRRVVVVFAVWAGRGECVFFLLLGRGACCFFAVWAGAFIFCCSGGGRSKGLAFTGLAPLRLCVALRVRGLCRRGLKPFEKFPP